MRLHPALGAGLSAIVLAYGWGCYYKSDGVSASVVDAETGVPVRDASVVAIWMLEKPAFHGHDYRALQRVETVTDSNGRFSIEPWSRWVIWPFWEEGHTSPYVYVLRAGYKFEIAQNSGMNSSFAYVRWSSSQIKLRAPDESPENYAIRLSTIRSALCDPYRDEGAKCSNALIEYFEAEKRRLITVGAKRAYW